MAIVEHSELAPLDDVVEPAWWSGTPPIDAAAYTIDCSDVTIDSNDLDHDDWLGLRMREIYDRSRNSSGSTPRATCAPRRNS